MDRLNTDNFPINLLVDILDDDDAVLMVVEEQLKMNGIENYRLFTDPDDFISKLGAKPHVCLIDYLLGGVLNGIHIAEIVLKQNPDCQTIMLTGIEGAQGYKVMKEFMRIEGRGRKWWVDKNEEDWQKALVVALQQALSYIRSLLDSRDRLLALEKPAIRRERKPLSVETNNS